MAINPGKKKLRTGTADPGRTGRRGLRLAVTGAVLICLLLICWLIPVCITADNPRFTVHHWAVNSSGHWAGREKELLQRLDLGGEDNLFRLSPETIRQQVKKIEDVEDASVKFILPDTVEVDIIERVPRAAQWIRYQGKLQPTGWYFDAKGNRFRQTGKPQMQLPRLLMTGREAPEAALKLIMTVLENYSRIYLRMIEPAGNVMTVQLDYIFGENRKAYQVIFPTDPDTDFRTLLNVFQSAVFSGSESRRRCDLSTPGKAIWR